MTDEDRNAAAELMQAGEDYLMMLGRLWRGDAQDMPAAKRERLISAVVEVVRRVDDKR